MADTIYNSTHGLTIPAEHIPVDEDLQRLADGDGEVVEQIISGLIGYVTGLINSYVAQRPASKPFKEDLVAEGLATLTEFVISKLGTAKVEASRFVPQVTGAIKNKTNDWLRENETTITVKARTQQRGVKPPKRHAIKEGHAVSGLDDIFNGVWAEDFTDELTDEELTVAHMRMDGASVHKISRELGLHRGRVERIITQIEHLYAGESR